MDKKSYIQVGYIQGVFGIKGWLKVFSYCRPKEQILEYTSWQLRTTVGEIDYQLEEGQVHGQSIIVKLYGVDTRNDAEQLRESEIWIATTELAKLSSGEYYWYQLTGLEVVTLQGLSLGVISRLIETGANDVLVVRKNTDSQEILIPYVPKEIIIDVDLEQKKMTVDWQADYI